MEEGHAPFQIEPTRIIHDTLTNEADGRGCCRHRISGCELQHDQSRCHQTGAADSVDSVQASSEQIVPDDRIDTHIWDARDCGTGLGLSRAVHSLVLVMEL